MANLSPNFLKQLSADGKKVMSQNPVLRAAGTVLTHPSVATGFSVGINVAAKGGKPAEVAAVRAKLQPAQKKGFDIAVATSKGMATQKAPTNMPPREQLAYYATHGLPGFTPAKKAEMMKTIAVDNSTRAGAVVALKERQGLWQKIKSLLGLR